MEKLSDINEALAYLKEGEIVSTDGKDQFILKNKKIYRYFSGSNFSLSLKDFVDLYKNSDFYLYEDNCEIDLEKDEAYYRYYKK